MVLSGSVLLLSPSPNQPQAHDIFHHYVLSWGQIKMSHTHTHTNSFPWRHKTLSQQRSEKQILHFIFRHNIVYPSLKRLTKTMATYLIKIWKAVRILTQTLVLSPESVTSSYFPKLLQIHDIQCTGQRKSICYNHGLSQEK